MAKVSKQSALGEAEVELIKAVMEVVRLRVIVFEQSVLAGDETEDDKNEITYLLDFAQSAKHRLIKI